MAKPWEGGPNFVFAPQWSSGKSNSGSGVKGKFGHAGTKRGRFNPNPTACNHPSCQIALRSKRDKTAHEARMKGSR